MQPSLPVEPADQNIKAVDPAKFAEIAEIVAIWASADDNE
jgi:hypothetical protein